MSKFCRLRKWFLLAFLGVLGRFGVLREKCLTFGWSGNKIRKIYPLKIWNFKNKFVEYRELSSN